MNTIQSKKGFTLVELLVVIAVISMLASIVLVALGPVRERGRDARRQSDIRQISTAMELCFDDASCGAGSEQYETNDSVAGKAPNAITAIGVYMDPVPTDPLNTGDHRYFWSKNDTVPTKYCVYTQLEGTTDWVAASEKGTKFDAVEPPAILDAGTDCW